MITCGGQTIQEGEGFDGPSNIDGNTVPDNRYRQPYNQAGEEEEFGLLSPCLGSNNTGNFSKCNGNTGAVVVLSRSNSSDVAAATAAKSRGFCGGIVDGGENVRIWKARSGRVDTSRNGNNDNNEVAKDSNENKNNDRESSSSSASKRANVKGNCSENEKNNDNRGNESKLHREYEKNKENNKFGNVSNSANSTAAVTAASVKTDAASQKKHQILRELGIIHLENKVARPRFHVDETEEDILRHAGVYHVVDRSNEEYHRGGAYRDEISYDRHDEMRRLWNASSMKKEMSEREVRILKEAGVAWVDLDKLERDIGGVERMSRDGYERQEQEREQDGGRERYYVGRNGNPSHTRYIHEQHQQQPPHLTKCNTNLTNHTQPTLQTHVSNTSYAEKELLRRLNNGWSSTGGMCDECQMPILRNNESGLYECVICGVMEMVGNDDCDDGLDRNYTGYDDTTDYYEQNEDDDADRYNIHGINEEEDAIDVPNSNMTTTNHTTQWEMHHHYCQMCNKLLMEDPALFGGGTGGMDSHHCIYCNSCVEDLIRNSGHNGIEDDDHYGDHNIIGYDNNGLDQRGVGWNNRNAYDKYRTAINNSNAYQEELGRRLFSGWKLLNLACPSCNLPLIEEYQGGPKVCLRCG